MTASGAGAFSGEPCPLSPSSPASASRPAERRPGGSGRRPSPPASRFRTLRPARGLWTALCALALSLLLATGTAQAQTSVKLVSNTGQNTDSTSPFSVDRAQPFTTGSNAAGYKLTSVKFPITGTLSVTNTQVRIESSGSNNKPGGSLGALTLTQSGTTVTGTTTGIDLVPNTTYFVVLISNDTVRTYQRTNSDNEDSGAAAGWSIGNTSYFTSASWQTSNTAWKLAIHGYAKGNSPPTVERRIPDQSAPVGTAFSYTFPANTFADPDGDTLTYTASAYPGGPLPLWLTFNAATRTFSGTAQASDAAFVDVQVTADDGNGGTVSDRFYILVNEPQRAAYAGAFASRGDKVQVYFSWRIKAGPASEWPYPQAWTVKVDGVSYGAYSVRYEDYSVTFWLSGGGNALFNRYRTVTVSYDKTKAVQAGTGARMQHAHDGTEIDSFFNLPVTILGVYPPPDPPPDTEAPTFSLASGHKSQVDVEWSEVLAYGSTVPSSAFTLTARKEDGSVQTIRGKADPVRYGYSYANFTVWMEEPVPSDAALTLSYSRPPDGQDQFRDRAGNVLESFSGKPVMSGRPRVQAVEVVSDPGEDETYGLGDTIRLQVRFDVPVRVNTSDGVPRLHVHMDSDYSSIAQWEGDGYRTIEYRYGWAHYEGGSGTDTLSFALRVAANNYGDGINLRRNALTTYYGGKIQSPWPWGFTQDADLSHAAVPHHPGHRVNGSVSLPKLQRASVAGNVLTLTFDRYLDTDPAPAPGDFHVTVNGVLFRRLCEDRSPGLFRAMGTWISHGVP